MASFSQLPSGKWRAQVRRAGLSKGATFTKKRDAKDWAAGIEGQTEHIAAGGFAPVPKNATVGDLIGKYLLTVGKEPGRTKAATLAMLDRRLGVLNQRLPELFRRVGTLEEQLADAKKSSS